MSLLRCRNCKHEWITAIKDPRKRSEVFCSTTCETAYKENNPGPVPRGYRAYRDKKRTPEKPRIESGVASGVKKVYKLYKQELSKNCANYPLCKRKTGINEQKYCVHCRLSRYKGMKLIWPNRPVKKTDEEEEEEETNL